MVLPCVLPAQVWVYPNPGEPMEESPYYKLTILQENKEFQSFVYCSKASHGNLSRSSSWSAFSFNSEVEVQVEVLGESISDCEIRPKSKGINYRIQGNKILFSLSQPHKLAIEINGDKSKPFFLFADPPEENIPENGAKGVWYFEPGVHNIGETEVPDTVKHIYVAGGACVFGAFKNTYRASNCKITGRGIISGLDVEARTTDLESINTIDFKGAGKNVLVQGITLLDGIGNGIQIDQSYSTVRNCKIFAWNAGSGGVQLGEHGLLEDCFFRCNGDAISLKRNFFVGRNCVFWQNETGAPFQISWNSSKDYHNFRIVNCDVVHCEHREEGLERAIFSAVHGGEGKLSNYHFENIRIEGDVFRLVKLTIRTNPVDIDPGWGSISNIYFKNIRLEGKSTMANEIWGYNAEHKISKVTFDGLSINGNLVRNADEGMFKINLNTAQHIEFK